MDTIFVYRDNPRYRECLEIASPSDVTGDGCTVPLDKYLEITYGPGDMIFLPPTDIICTPWYDEMYRRMRMEHSAKHPAGSYVRYQYAGRR
jgi:hypothetical protein